MGGDGILISIIVHSIGVQDGMTLGGLTHGVGDGIPDGMIIGMELGGIHVRAAAVSSILLAVQRHIALHVLISRQDDILTTHHLVHRAMLPYAQIVVMKVRAV